MDKHCSLSRKFVNYGQKSFITLTLGRDIEISDDEADFDVDADATSKIFEIVEEKKSHPPRKPSLLLNATPKLTPTRKRSVTFEPIDVAGIKPPSPKQIEVDEDLPDVV